MVWTKNRTYKTVLFASVKLCVATIMTGLSFGLDSLNDNTPPSERLYWVGLPIAVAGVIGITAAVTNSRIVMICYLFACVIGCVVSVIGLVFVGLAASTVISVDKNCEYRHSECYCLIGEEWIAEMTGTCHALTSVRYILCSLIALCIITAGLSLVGSVVACRAVCVTSSTPTTTSTAVHADVRRHSPQDEEMQVTMVQTDASQPNDHTTSDQDLLIS